MAEIYKHLHQGLVSNTSGGVATYSAPTSPVTTTIIRHMRVVNVDTSNACQLTLWHMPASGSTASVNLIFPATDILAGGSAEFDGTIILDSGDRLFAMAETANDLYLNIYGLELT